MIEENYINKDKRIFYLALFIQIFLCVIQTILEVTILYAHYSIPILLLIFGILPPLIMFIATYYRPDFYYFFRKIFSYSLILFLAIISIVSGGVRSISFLMVMVIPVVTAVFHENIIKPSIAVLVLFSILVVFYSFESLDTMFMSFCVFKNNALLAVNSRYVIFFYFVFFSLFIFSCFFSREDAIYRNTIEMKNIKLEKAKNEIELSSQQKTNFFTNLAHESRTPLTKIINRLKKIQFKFDNLEKNSDVKECFQAIQREANKLCRNIDNISYLQKLDHGIPVYVHERIINFSKFLKEEIKSFHSIAYDKNIKISSEIEDNLYVIADPQAIDQIISNLISNALKYTNWNGAIYIDLHLSNEDIVFIVKDTGVGINKEQQKTVFQRYFQITHKKRNTQGLGLGLSVVQEAVQSLKGSLQLSSTVGKGTVFKIQLKRYILKSNDKVYDEAIISNPIIDPEIKLDNTVVKPNCKNILIVEDDKEIINVIIESVGEEYNVFYALNGKEALAKLDRIRPELIVSDIMMPEMDGDMLIQEVKKKDYYRNIPFIFLTAKTGHENRISGLKKGAIAYVEKPFYGEELLAQINTIMYDIYSIKSTELESSEKEWKFNEKCLQYNITKREKEIIEAVCKGLGNKEIAYNFDLKISTIKKHLENIYDKCQVSNRTELTNIFIS